jgi:predicted dehydrogenase
MEAADTPVIGVGIIAFGLSGRVFHAAFVCTNPKFKLVAVYERSKSESQEFASKHGLTIDLMRSESDLVNRADIQLVVVCSPIEFHYEHAMLALQAGKHVLVEKAFCSTSEQAQMLLDFAKSKNLVCMPYQNRRYDSDFLTIQQVVPRLGRIAEYNGYFNRFSPNVRAGHWKDTVAGSGGNFLSLGSHMIDQALVLFGLPERVWADVRAQRDGAVLDDAWEVHLYYSSGETDSTGMLHGGFRAILKGSLLCRNNALRYMIHGTNGSWIKEGTDTQEAHLMTGKLPEYIPARESEAGEGDADAGVGYGSEPADQWGVLTLVADRSIAGASATDGLQRTPPVRGSYHHLYDGLYRSIVHGAPPVVDASVAVAVLRVIEIARQSSAEGRVLPFSY